MKEKADVEATVAIKPADIKIDQKTLTDSHIKFVAEPWESGYGHTVGNALRRVLLSSMEGVAVTSIQIDGVSHEFMSIPDVMEDVMEIVLNVKKLKFNCTASLPRKLELRADTAGPVTAANIREDGMVEVLNKDQLICTLDKNRDFRMELEIDRGRGYRVAEENKRDDQNENVIVVDSLFSPVEKVRYDVQPCRVGARTNYDSLEMEITTDRRILPLEALNKAATILRDLFDVFVREHVESNNELQEPDTTFNDEEKDMLDKLVTPVAKLKFSVRSVNCLSGANIQYVGQLVEKSESQMLKCRNFGRKSLTEIHDKLKEMGLSLEMNLSDSVKDAFQHFLANNSNNKEEN